MYPFILIRNTAKRSSVFTLYNKTPSRVFPTTTIHWRLTFVMHIFSLLIKQYHFFNSTKAKSTGRFSLCLSLSLSLCETTFPSMSFVIRGVRPSTETSAPLPHYLAHLIREIGWSIVDRTDLIHHCFYCVGMCKAKSR